MSSSNSQSSATTEAAARVPRLAGASGAGVAYAQWRQAMQSFLMRQNVKASDYTEPIPDWIALVERCHANDRASERDAIDLVLGRRPRVPASSSSTSLPSSSSKTSMKSEPSLTTPVKPALVAVVVPTDDEKAALTMIAAVITRSQKACGYLYAALPTDLAALVVNLPQGYAFALWDFLERKFRNTERDSVAALWRDFTRLRMEDTDDTFDCYKARVDSTVELLTHAKQIVPSGLYTSIITENLLPRYSQVILAMTTGGKLVDTDNINWREVTDAIGAFERKQGDLGDASTGSASAMVARGAPRNHASPSSKSHSSSSSSKDRCFNCNGLNHYSNKCPLPPTKETLRIRAARAESRKRGHSSKGFIAQHSEEDDDSDSSVERAHSARAHNPPAGEHPARHTARSYAAVVFASVGKSKATAKPAAAAASASSPNPVADDAPRTFKRLITPNSMPIGKPLTTPPPRVVTPPKASPPKAAAPAAAAAAPAAAAPAKQPRAKSPPPPKKAAKLAAEQAADEHRRAAKAREDYLPTQTLDTALKTTAKAIDTAATVHLTCNRESLHSIQRCQPMPVLMADNTIVNAVHKGKLTMRLPAASRDGFVQFTLEPVYYHERFAANLISWDALDRAGWHMSAGDGKASFTTPGGTAVKAQRRGGLMIFNDRILERAFGARGGNNVMCVTSKELLQLHNRLGHVSWDRLIDMCRAGLTIGVGEVRGLARAELERAKDAVRACPHCAQAKMHRKPVGHAGLDKGSEPGSVLHMDSLQVITTDPTNGAKRTLYSLSAKDAYTDFWWVDSVRAQADLQQAAIDVMEHSHTMSGRYPRLLITDLGTEFDNGKVRAFCRTHGIQHQPSPARAKELNGLSEKSVDTLKNHARAMIFGAGIPDSAFSFYALYALLHVVYVWNRTHLGQRTGVPPLQAMTGRETSVLNVDGEFGCDVYVHQHRDLRRETFDRKAEPGIYLGHDGRLNCPRVLLLRSGKIVCSKDVLWREGQFNHARAHTSGQQNSIGRANLDDLVSADWTELTAPIVQDSDDAEVFEASRTAASPPADGSEHYTVESIIGTRIKRGVREYHVKWANYDLADATWEPAASIEQDVPDFVQDYVQANANSAPPPPPARAPPARTATTRSASSGAAAAASSSSAAKGRAASAPSAAAAAPVDSSEDELDDDATDGPRPSEARMAAAYAARCL